MIFQVDPIFVYKLTNVVFKRISLFNVKHSYNFLGEANRISFLEGKKWFEAFKSIHLFSFSFLEK